MAKSKSEGPAGSTGLSAHPATVHNGPPEQVVARVLAIHGERSLIESDGHLYRCVLSGKLKHARSGFDEAPGGLNTWDRDTGESRGRWERARAHAPTSSPVAVGDMVHARVTAEGAGMILDRLDRRTWLGRIRQGKGPQVIAANVDIALVVFSVAWPTPDLFLLDQMLVQASAGGLEPWIVLNKIDLLDASCPPSAIDDGANDLATPAGPIDTSLAQEIESYRDTGYPVFRTSARAQVGTPALDAALRDRTAVLIGPSGAGKSHILNCLAPTADAQLGEISEWSGRGQHTTTYVAMYPLAGRGYLVDAPGIRRLMLWQVAPEKLPSYFPEFAATAGLCDYTGCSHLTEDGCAVRDAAEQGAISPRRYRHYCEMRKSAARSRRG